MKGIILAGGSGTRLYPYSCYDFSKAIFNLSKINVKVNRIETSQHPTPAKRPYLVC